MTGELEAQQAREVARSLEAAAEWPSLRSASREKYRADNASVARRAAELKLLEEEAVARPSGWVEQPEAAMDVEPCEPGVVSSSEC